MKRATRGVTLHAGGIARATVVGNADGGCTRYEDPALSCLLRREEQQSRQCPLRCGYRHLNASLLLYPGDPCRHAVGGTPPQDGTCTAPTLGAGWCRVTPTCRGSTVSSILSRRSRRRRRKLDLFESLTGSPQALPAAANPALPDTATRRVDGRAVNHAAGGSDLLLHAAIRRLLLARAPLLSISCHGRKSSLRGFWLTQRLKDCFMAVLFCNVQ